MRLKRLEIQGFKSFARPVSLEFGPGITAIVGPNGSGKSNISDAIRWVLGEQSARSLRGQRMEDVIFAGSDGKRPLGMAEVSLTLDNSHGFLPVDYAEVAIARRVYRSGDSEFLINKQNCRLKDIHDLLTDTGLGREGYAIIGQGQLDAVLSVRSEDRRILLEETAGIVKYRQRKEEALRKLQDTDLDLLRVTDILHELESQLGPLSKQAERARIYLALVDELQESELDYDHLLWHKLETKGRAAADKQAQLKAEYDAWTSDFAQLQEEKSRLEALLGKLEKELDGGQEELIALTDAYNQGVHTIKLYTERQTDHEGRCRELAEAAAAQEAELAALQDQTAALEAQMGQLNNEIAVQERQVQQAQADFEQAQAKQGRTQAKINTLKDEFFEFMRLLAEQRNQQRSFDERRQNLKSQAAAGAEELKQLEGELDSAAQRLVALTELERQLFQGKAEQHKAEESILNKLTEHKELLQQNLREHRHLEGKSAQLASRLSTLQELEEGYQGYTLGVRRLMQEPKMSALVLGTVAEVITVPEGLETAYEVALGSAVQNVITANEEDAKTLIDWLKKVQAGRVTFLPLNTMRGSEFSRQELERLQMPGVLGAGLELLDFPQQFRPVLASLLGRIVITEDLDTALALKRKLARFARLVTRDGSVVFPSGAMTGGSWKQRTLGLLTRKAELNDLERELLSVQEQEKSLLAQGERLAALCSALEAELEENRAKQVELKLEQQSAVQSKKQLEMQLDAVGSRWREMAERLQELRMLLSSLDGDKEAAAATVEQLETEEDSRRVHIQQLEKALIEQDTQLEAASEAHTKRRVHLAELKGQRQNLATQAENLCQRKQSYQRLQEEAREELGRLQREQAEFTRIVREIKAQNELRAAKTQELKTDLGQKRSLRRETQQEKAALDLELNDRQKEQLAKERALYKCEAELETLAKDREQILATLTARGLTLAHIVDREVTVPEEPLKEKLQQLRDKIRKLGLVNPAAAQEFEAVQERCEFLKEQLKDLNGARESLQGVIREMDKLCRTRLLEVFKRVKKEFNNIFTRLFMGGKAELIMTDPDSVLTTGIDIMAQPPGKKLQNLLLLSGGERALTSIALLFAIRRIKPTPFCVLDEIDAALDESNLHRFVQLMEEFSQETQFLVITHRQPTMEAADTLYGVTMGEEAISQIISVALT